MLNCLLHYTYPVETPEDINCQTAVTCRHLPLIGKTERNQFDVFGLNVSKLDTKGTTSQMTPYEPFSSSHFQVRSSSKPALLGKSFSKSAQSFLQVLIHFSYAQSVFHSAFKCITLALLMDI